VELIWPLEITSRALAKIERDWLWFEYIRKRQLDLRDRCACDLSEEQCRDAALHGYVLEHNHGLPNTAVSSANPLAEWIFARHARPAGERTSKLLYKEALTDPDIGTGLLKKNFQAAYNNVYTSEPHRPPAGGWPLQPKYQQRWLAQAAVEISLPEVI
jgi:hypothetical protein